MKKVNTEGFTLIEVLIAALILFSSISLVAEIYSSSSVSSQKSIQRVQFFQTMSLANKRINIELRNMAKESDATNFSGSFDVLGVNYQWQANRERFLSPPYDEYNDIRWPARFGVFNVEISATQERFKRNYKLKVVTW